MMAVDTLYVTTKADVSDDILANHLTGLNSKTDAAHQSGPSKACFLKRIPLCAVSKLRLLSTCHFCFRQNGDGDMSSVSPKCHRRPQLLLSHTKYPLPSWQYPPFSKNIKHMQISIGILKKALKNSATGRISSKRVL